MDLELFPFLRLITSIRNVLLYSGVTLFLLALIPRAPAYVCMISISFCISSSILSAYCIYRIRQYIKKNQ